MFERLLAFFRMDDSPEDEYFYDSETEEPEEKETPFPGLSELHRSNQAAGRPEPMKTGTVVNKNLNSIIARYSEEQKARQYLGYDKGLPYSIYYDYGDCLLGFIPVPEWTEGRELEPKPPTNLEELQAYYDAPPVYHNVYCGRIQKEEITPEYQAACRDLIRQYLKAALGCTFNIDRGGYYNHYLLCFQDVPFTEELHKSIIRMCRDFTEATRYKALPDRKGGVAA